MENYKTYIEEDHYTPVDILIWYMKNSDWYTKILNQISIDKRLISKDYKNSGGAFPDIVIQYTYAIYVCGSIFESGIKEYCFPEGGANLYSSNQNTDVVKQFIENHKLESYQFEKLLKEDKRFFNMVVGASGFNMALITEVFEETKTARRIAKIKQQIEQNERQKEHLMNELSSLENAGYPSKTEDHLPKGKH